MKLKFLGLLASVVAVALAASSMLSQAEEFPSKPIRLVVPWNPGGPTDLMGRYVAQRMSEVLKQPVVVENRSGASGIVGSTAVMKSAPDGYALLFVTVGTHAINASLFRSIPYDPVKDFEPVAIVGSSPNVLVAHPSLKIKSVRELIDYAKANPGKVSYASGGNGVTSHLAAELFRSMAGIEMRHVPYQGNAAALIDIVAGRVPLGFQIPSTAAPMIKEGKLVPLGITSSKRQPMLPDVPTIAESGLPGYELLLWFGVVAPKGTPKHIVDVLNKAVNAGMNSDEAAKQLARWDTTVMSDTPAGFGEYMAAEVAKWAKVVKESGAQVD